MFNFGWLPGGFDSEPLLGVGIVASAGALREIRNNGGFVLS